jgi:hypothetical protein
MGLLMSILASSGKMFCAKIAQKPIHINVNIQSTNFFILRIENVKI